MQSGSFTRLRDRIGLSEEQLAGEFGVELCDVRRWSDGAARPPVGFIRAFELLADFSPAKPTGMSAFRFIDLFAGIGGLRRGFEAAGGRCVFTSEWNEYSRKTYRANFPDDDHEIAGDIRAIAASDIPQHDLLLAGFPCQPFSIAGVSKKNALGRNHGFRCEAQGTLFFDIARMIEHHRPRAFVLENVKNLVSHDRGQTFRVIHDALKNELGYEVYTQIINSRSFVPQHRERIFDHSIHIRSRSDSLGSSGALRLDTRRSPEATRQRRGTLIGTLYGRSVRPSFHEGGKRGPGNARQQRSCEKILQASGQKQW